MSSARTLACSLSVTTTCFGLNLVGTQQQRQRKRSQENISKHVFAEAALPKYAGFGDLLVAGHHLKRIANVRLTPGPIFKAKVPSRKRIASADKGCSEEITFDGRRHEDQSEDRCAFRYADERESLASERCPLFFLRLMLSLVANNIYS